MLDQTNNTHYVYPLHGQGIFFCLLLFVMKLHSLKSWQNFVEIWSSKGIIHKWRNAKAFGMQFRCFVSCFSAHDQNKLKIQRKNFAQKKQRGFTKWKVNDFFSLVLQKPSSQKTSAFFLNFLEWGFPLRYNIRVTTCLQLWITWSAN